jgi:hypothetical protein
MNGITEEGVVQKRVYGKRWEARRIQRPNLLFYNREV